jgi:signal transduction histidine kinase
MIRDHFEVLHSVVRIANQMAFDYPRSFKSILRYLRRALGLEEAVFLLLDSRKQIFSQSVQATGTDLFLPRHTPCENTPEGTSLKRHKPLRSASCLHLPVYNQSRDFGVLSLRTTPDSPLSEDSQPVLQGVCDQLASMVQYGLVSGEERRRVTQLTMLSELGRELTRAQTLRELMQVAVRTIQKHFEAACVILRPVHGETLLGRSLVRISPSSSGLRRVFLDLEEELSVQVLSDGKPVYRQGSTRGREASPASSMTLVTVPLKIQDQVLGTLSLFGTEDGKGIPLAADREARRLCVSVGSLVAHALERVVGKERLTSLSADNDRKLRETTLLYRTSRAMHSTLRLNELMHLILSAAALPEGGGFERAMLFMINERSGTLQGMLGVTAKTAALVLPPQQGSLTWESPEFGEDIRIAQSRSRFCRQVMRQRLPFDPADNALARAAFQERVLLVTRPASEPPSGAALAEALQLAPYACAPMLGRDRALGVLVVDNPDSGEEIASDRLRFLELFASLAGAAMENSMLLNRLETAHQDLRETQEKLIQGEKMAGLGEMAASVAHELRNPLVAIGGFAQRLNRLATGSREREYSSIVVREVRRMEEMLANILAFSKKQMLCVAPCDVVDIIEEALSLEADALNRRAIRLVTDIAKDLPPIRGDEQKLRQVMINLIANSLQVMPAGGTLTLRAYPDALRGDKAVAVEVEDTGGGISAEIMRNIFNPFFTTKDEGTGLGLSISHRIIEHHGGEIEVQNRERGALFILRLPVDTLRHLSVDKKRLFG